MISLIMLGSVINYLARSTLAVAAPTMLQELHISVREYSWIVGAFQGAIMAQPICGYVLDVLGLKIGFAIFAVTWSLVNMAHSLANSWQALAWLRGALGFAEGSANPAGMKATAEWFPAKERGLAGGVYNIGASVGSMLAPPLVAWAILAYTGGRRSLLPAAWGWFGPRCGFCSTNRPIDIPRSRARRRRTLHRGRKSIFRATARGRR